MSCALALSSMSAFGATAAILDSDGNDAYPDGVVSGTNYGVYASAGNAASLTVENISIDVSNIGAIANGAGASVVLGESGTTDSIEITIGSESSPVSNSAYALVSQLGGELSVAADSGIGLYVYSSTAIAYGLATFADSSSTVDTGNLEIVTSGSTWAIAVYSGSNSSTAITADSVAASAVSDTYALGLLMYSGSVLDMDAEEINVTATGGSEARGIEVDSGALTLGNSSSAITVTAAATSDSGTAMGILALASGASITIEGQSLEVVAEGDTAWGIHVQNNTQEETAPDDAASIVINAESTTVTSDTVALSAFSNGQLTVNGNLTATADHVIDVRGYSTVTINESGTGTVVLNGDIVFETPNVEGGSSNGSGNILDAYVNITLSGEDSSWTGRSYQTYSYVDESGETTTVVTSTIGENTEYVGQVTGLTLTVSDGATVTTTGDSFANVLSFDSGNLNLADDSTLYVNDFSVEGDENNIVFASGSDIDGTINDYGTLYLTGDMSGYTGELNVIGAAAIGLTADEAAETLSSADGSVLLVAAGSTLYGTVEVGSGASATGSDGSSLSLLSDGTLIIMATDDYVEGTALLTVDTASAESGSTLKLVNSTKIADGTTVFATSDGSEPSEYTLVTDNLLKVVENNQIVSQSATAALGDGIIVPNTVEEALLVSGTGSDRIIALTTDTTADAAVRAINNIALMATAGAAQVVSVNTSNMIADTIDQHGSLLAAYDHEKEGADLWIDLNSTFSKASSFDAGSSSYGYKSDIVGATIGTDYAFGNGVAAGAAFSIGTGNARGKGNGAGVKNDINYWGLNLYGVWTTPYVNLIGNVGYLQSQNKLTHQGYKAKPDVKTISVGIRAEKSFDIGEAFAVTPHVGVRYLNVDMDAFTAGGFRYDSEKANLVQFPVGVAASANVKTKAGATVKPFLDLQIAPTAGDRKATNKFGLDGGSATDSIEARIAANAMYSAKVGLQVAKGSHAFGFHYGIGAGGDARVDQSLQAKYRYSF